MRRPPLPIGKPDTNSITIYSHDWTDKTTWYPKATRVVDEVATDSGDRLTYTLANDYLIDTYHGKLVKEDYLKDGSNNSYRVVVKVNDVAKTERDPHVGSGGDYTINYYAGTVTFLSALAPSDVVKVTYHYATTSEFIVKPDAGKILSIDFVEVQFSTDVDLTDSSVFQPRGLVDVFAPQLTPDPYDSGTLIPIQDPIIYKGMRDYQADAVRSWPTYPALGGSSWRGMSEQIVIFDWDYLRAKPLYSKYGMEISVKLEHDVPFGGTYASATFYCAVEDE